MQILGSVRGSRGLERTPRDRKLPKILRRRRMFQRKGAKRGRAPGNTSSLLHARGLTGQQAHISGPLYYGR
eukprot:2807055-Pyramimonas_sp.AAC.1